jgi:hypothetical protein
VVAGVLHNASHGLISALRLASALCCEGVALCGI